MTKVNHFALNSKSSEENLLSEANPETKEQQTCARDCPRFDSCSAPLCPLDAGSLNGSIWYSDEEICTAQGFGQLPWIRNQKKISRRCRDTSGYFTLEMLSHNCQIKGGITGLDPDTTDIDDSRAVKKWLMAHPEKREISEEERQERRIRMIELNRRSTPTENTRQLRKINPKVALETGERDITDESHTNLPLSPYSGDICTKNAV